MQGAKIAPFAGGYNARFVYIHYSGSPIAFRASGLLDGERLRPWIQPDIAHIENVGVGEERALARGEVVDDADVLVGVEGVDEVAPDATVRRRPTYKWMP